VICGSIAARHNVTWRLCKIKIFLPRVLDAGFWIRIYLPAVDQGRGMARLLNCQASHGM